MPTTPGFDPFDPQQGTRHHEAMAELRAACPVARLSSGMLVVPRYADVKSMLSDAHMSNANAARAPGIAVPEEDRFFFFEYDPPLHVPLRRLLHDLLSRQRAEAATPEVRALITELLSPLLEAGGGEVVEDFTAPFAGRLMMRLAGFPEADAPRWRLWVRDMIRSGFSFTNRNDRGTGFERCYPDLLEYLDRHIDDRTRSAARPDDALTLVVTAELDGQPLPRTLQRMILVSIPTAGGNTMGNFINNTLLSLATEPALVEALRADRARVPDAVEESLRRDSPSMFISRTCRKPAQVHETSLAAGQQVLLGLASANRDETVYQDPETFRLDRPGQPPHVAFGWGTHTCVGAHIVRHAGATLLDTLLDLVAAIELEPGTTPRPYLSPQGNGLDELRLRLTRS
ncbi:MAG: cytochrome P450 [Trebonia sp.]